jgi:hypothetical protein
VYVVGHKDYDVFICYRGTEVTAEFVDHFQEAPALVGFKAYVDAKDVSEGEMAWNSLSHAIRVAPVCVPVLSKTFAESKACLEELSVMVGSIKVLLPYLHDITPSDMLMLKTGALKHAFLKLKDHHSA